ncbi:hypothetical protein BO1005MUT1_300065 [Hyphomicrobiales bacterium]|nr:hypothetical protein BO1005MUT1_300065 [Hyphomicrobiales bacterium]
MRGVATLVARWIRQTIKVCATSHRSLRATFSRKGRRAGWRRHSRIVFPLFSACREPCSQARDRVQIRFRYAAAWSCH